jgi:metacaspase-1
MATGVSLHIGLNRVDPNHYRDQFGQPWSGDLVACENDARDMQRIATEQGFTAEILLTADGTTEAVLGALERASRKLDAGDTLFVTYSGHGGQVRDLHSEETDRLDETWCLFDRELVDDELYAAWARFEKGVRILVLSDSCHSGTVIRTLQRERDQLVRALEEGELPRPRALPMGVVAGTYVAHRDAYDAIQDAYPSGETANVAASVLLMSGCQDHQVSMDGAFNGAFTAALLDTWDNGAFQGTYQTFHEAIVASMPESQRSNFFKTGASNQAFEAERPFTIA